MQLPVAFSIESAPSEIYTLSLHDALPICRPGDPGARATRLPRRRAPAGVCRDRRGGGQDRKSTRLNSSHVQNAYAVFCPKQIERMDLIQVGGSKQDDVSGPLHPPS